MNSLKVLIAIGVLSLSACGGDSIQSPDFTSKLDSIVIDDAPDTTPVGREVQLTATGRFTTPPGSSPAFISRPIEASFSVDDADIATVDAMGVFIGRALGIARVTASADGRTSPAISIQVTAPVLDALVIDPATARIGLGGMQRFTAQGRFSDSDTPRGIDTPITWVSSQVSVATVSPATGPSTVATSVSEGTTEIRASTVSDEGETITGTAALTVGDAEIEGLLRVEPPTAFVAQGFERQFVAIGSFSDDSEQPVMNELIDWSSSAPAVATVDDNGLATGVTAGQATITATLKPGVVATGVRTVSASLIVTDAVCTTPFAASAGATVTSEVDGLCVGCEVQDAPFVIDALPLTVAVIRVPLAVLGATASLTATAAEGVSFPGGTPAGFVVRRPRNPLLTAELLAALNISTLSNGAVVETSSEAIPLRVALLGGFGEDEVALVSFTPTQRFDALRLEQRSLVAALARTQVASACATVNEAELPVIEEDIP